MQIILPVCFACEIFSLTLRCTKHFATLNIVQNAQAIATNTESRSIKRDLFDSRRRYLQGFHQHFSLVKANFFTRFPSVRNKCFGKKSLHLFQFSLCEKFFYFIEFQFVAKFSKSKKSLQNIYYPSLSGKNSFQRMLLRKFATCAFSSCDHFLLSITF